MELYEFLAKGGPVMLPIILFSIVALAAFFERLWSLRRSVIMPPKLIEQVGSLLTHGRIEEAHTLAESSDTAAGRMADEGIRYYGRRRGLISEVLEEAGRREIVVMEKITGLLSTIATVAPLLGLLGTVTGMIGVFQQIVIHGADKGEVDAAALAGGIWEAMLTTAAGLCVAIPAYLAYRFLLSRIDAYAEELAEFATALLECLSPEDERPRQRDSIRDVGEKNTSKVEMSVDDETEEVDKGSSKETKMNAEVSA